MYSFPFRLKQYLRLLINYIRYDFAILFYILLVLTSVFFTIMMLVHTEINRNLLSYGGLDEAETSYAVNLGLNSTQKELLYLLELLEPYNLTEINDLWIGLPPIYPHGAAALNPPVDDSELDGRSFTEQELIDGKNVIILSGEDYLTYFRHSAIGDMLPIYGTEFQLIGISYASEHSLIPLNYILTAQTAYSVSQLTVRTEHKINYRERKTIEKKYIQQLPDKSRDTFSFESHFWRVFVDIKNSISHYLLSIGMIFVLCALLFFQTSSILYHKNLQHSRVYLLSGGSENFLKRVILSELTVAAVISFFLAYLLLLGRILWIE